MTLALPISFTSYLNNRPADHAIDRISSIVHTELSKKQANNINTKGGQIRYNGTADNNEWNILYFVDQGSFSIVEKNGKLAVSYRILIGNLIFKAIIISLIGILYNRSWWAGPVFFFGVGGINITIIYFRHRRLLKNIISQINSGAADTSN